MDDAERAGAGATGTARALRRAALTAGAAGAARALAEVASQIRVARAARPLTDRWQQVPVEPRGRAKLGISFRPLQAEALGLDPVATLATLLDYPFQLIRLGAYWNRIEDGPGRFDTGELDRQVDAAEQAGKQIIVCVGPVKTFGYPEFFVPGHHLPEPLREGALVEPAAQSSLLDASTAFAARVVKRYRDRRAVVAWQVEHDAVDPLGMEHSWRLSAAFVRREVEAVRAADPTRPVMMNGFLPTSAPVRAAAVVAHPRPGRFAGGCAAAGRHRRCRLLPAARAGGSRRADRLPGRQPHRRAARRRRDGCCDWAAAADGS